MTTFADLGLSPKILKALEKSGGVRKNAATLLGITFRSIRYRLAKYGLGDDSDEESEG